MQGGTCSAPENPDAAAWCTAPPAAPLAHAAQHVWPMRACTHVRPVPQCSLPAGLTPGSGPKVHGTVSGSKNPPRSRSRARGHKSGRKS